MSPALGRGCSWPSILMRDDCIRLVTGRGSPHFPPPRPGCCKGPVLKVGPQAEAKQALGTDLGWQGGHGGREPVFCADVPGAVVGRTGRGARSAAARGVCGWRDTGEPYWVRGQVKGTARWLGLYYPSGDFCSWLADWQESQQGRTGLPPPNRDGKLLPDSQVCYPLPLELCKPQLQRCPTVPFKLCTRSTSFLL